MLSELISSMAAGYKYFCPLCGFALEGWDECHSYIEYPAGKRTYFYHPDDAAVVSKIATSFYGRMATQEEERALLQKHGGNEGDYVCRDCRERSRLDPRKDALKCQSCGSACLEKIMGLEGKKCLWCEGILISTLCAIS